MSSIFDTSQTTATTLPSWFSNAQQNIAQQAGTAMGGTTPFNQTVGQGVVSSLQPGANNPFTSATNTLQSVAQGAANPWMANGQPNTQTALGGLFSAQNAKLDQILPQVAAREGAAGIGSGNFGSLRGQTAVDTARAGALSTLAEQQNQAALNAQNQAIQAAQGMGNLQQQYGTTGLNVANWQQQGNLPALTQYSNIINAMGPTANKTATQTSSISPYESALRYGNIAMGAGQTWQQIQQQMPWLTNILQGGLNSIGNSIGDYFTSSPDVSNPGSTGMTGIPIDESIGSSPAMDTNPYDSTIPYDPSTSGVSYVGGLDGLGFD